MAQAKLDSLEGVPEALQGEYEKGAGGKYFLKIEGIGEGSDHPAVLGLVSALQRHTKGEAEAKAAAARAKEEAEALALEKENLLKGTVPKDNITALEKSYQEKLTKRETELTGQVGQRDGVIRTLLVDDVARAIATSMAKEPINIEVLLPHIQKRLAAEVGPDGVGSTRVLDRDGKPSAYTIADLKKEFLDNPAFAPLLLGSKATGGGAQGGAAGGGAPPKKIDLTKATPAEKVAHYKAKQGLTD
jgi:hypothetical protein